MSFNLELAAILGAAIFIAALGAMTFWLAQRFRHNLREARRHYLHALRLSRNKIGQLQRDIEAIEQKRERDFPAGEAEPYGSRTKELQQTLIHLERRRGEHLERYSHLARRRPTYADHLPGHIWFKLWGQARYWHQLNQETQALRRSVAEALPAELEAAQAQLQGLYNLPAEAAHWTQQLYQTIDDSLALLARLRRAGVQGDGLDQAGSSLKQLQDGLRSLPVCFFLTSAAEVLRQATGQDVKTAWPVLERAAPVIDSWFEKLQSWLARHRELGAALEATQQQVEAVEIALKKSPDGLVIDDHLARLKQTRQVMAVLEKTYGALSLDAFGEFEKVVSEIAKAAAGLGEQAEEIQYRFQQLQEALSRNAELLANLKTTMSQAARAETYAVSWQASSTGLENLQKQAAALGPLNLQRTPEQLKLHGRQAQAITRAVQELTGSVAEALSRRQALIPLLEEPVLWPPVDWARQAAELEAKIGIYAPENWQPAQQVTNLKAEGQRFEKRRQELFSGYAIAAPLSERWLEAGFVSSVEELVGALKAFSERLQSIEATLASIQAGEQAARQELENSRQAIERLLKRFQAIDLPWAGSKITGQVQKLHKLQQKDGYKLAALFKRQNVGRVGKKTDQLEDWTKKCLSVLNHIARHMELEIEAAKAGLRSQVESLRQVAAFDQEPALRESEALLAGGRSDEAAAPADPQAGPATRLDHLVYQVIEPQLEVRQALYIAHRNLLSQIRDLIERPQADLNEAHQKALAAFEELSRLQSVARSNGPALESDTAWAEKLLAYANRDRETLPGCRTVKEALQVMARSKKYYEDALAEVQAKMIKLQQE